MAPPRKHPPSDAAETIQSLAASGHSQIGIAAKLGISRHTFMRWLDESEALQDAFDLGRETERQALHALIVQSALLNKPANVNAFFLLKARHGYRENDQASNQVNVAVEVKSVMVVKDHGSDAEWQAKAAEQQRALTQGHMSAVALTGPSVLAALPESVSASASPTVLVAPRREWEAPAWKQNA
jgi:hypothetical protein